MKPILYESTETLFQSNGLGVLADCISAHVLEERNGQYEAEFEYPVDGIHYSDILEGRIILISHDESGDLQPFDIYGHSKTINGVTTFYAHHIAYRQNGITVKPFTATSLSQTLTKIKQNSVNTNPFNYSTDKSVSASFQLTSPKPLRSILGGEEGSLLDVYGTGEYEWDRFQVILHLHRGTDSGVVVRYGKNLISLQDDIDYSDSYNGIVPFWYGQNTPADGEEAVETLVTLSEWVLYKTGSTYDGRNTVIPVDFSAQFQTIPTEAQLRTAAQSYLDRGNPLLPKDTLTFDFVELSKTEEYSYLALQQVNLCDTVTVVYDDINTAMKVISVDWDVLNERYRSLTLGDAPATYAQVITDRLATIAENANEGARLAKLWATNALSIAGNTDQYFWFAGTGTDTGAHITEVPKNTFLADPTHGGGNLIARSNGIAARDGLTELATFGANGSRVGLAGGAAVTTQTDGIRLFDGAGNNCAFFGVDGNNPSVRIGKTDLNGHIRITPSSGVRFLREDDSTPMAQLASDGLQIWANDGTNNTSVAFYGAQCRVGPIADKNVYIGNGAINFRDNGTSLGEFTGTLARIGKADSSHIEIGATNGMNIFDQNNKIRLNASSTGISIFDYASSSSTTPINVAQFNTTARIGPADAQHINITTGGLDVYNSNNVSIASFGALTRIGAIADATTRTEISSSGVKFIYRVDSSNSYTLADIEYRNAYGDHTISKSPTYTFGVRGTGSYGKYSFAVGSSNIASELLSTAFGLGTSATNVGAFAEGWSTTASGKYSHAEGYMTTAGSDYQHVMGKCNGNDSNNAFEIGNGTVSAPTNIFEVGWNGDVYTAGALSVGGNFYVDSSGNVDLTLGAHYKINGSNLSASDVNAVPNSNGTLSGVKPYGSSNTKIGFLGTNSSDSISYLMQFTGTRPILFDNRPSADGGQVAIWEGYTTLHKPTASDVGALPIGGGTLTGNLYINGSVNVKNASGINSYNGSNTLRTLAFISSTNVYWYGSGSYDNSEGSAYYEGNAVNIRSKGAVSITAPSGVSNTGKYNALYRITSTTVAPGSIGANSAKAAANYDITDYSTYINAGYEPVAISGDATDNSAISAFARIYDVSGTKKIRATFRNNSSSSVTTNYYFYILWLKGTSA